MHQKYSLPWIQEEADQFLQILRNFLEGEGLNELAGPIDHLAFRTNDFDDYAMAIETLFPDIVSGQYVDMNNRRVATVMLETKIDLAEFGQTNWVELKEPKPANADYRGLDHMEIFQSDLEKVKELLECKNISYEFQDNSRHRAVVVKMDDTGREIKFPDITLVEVLKLEEAAGKLIKIK